MLTAPGVASVPVLSGRQECEGRLPDSAKAAIYTIGQGRCLGAPTLTAAFCLLATVEFAVGRSSGPQGPPGRPGVRDVEPLRAQRLRDSGGVVRRRRQLVARVARLADDERQPVGRNKVSTVRTLMVGGFFWDRSAGVVGSDLVAQPGEDALRATILGAGERPGEAPRRP